MSGPIPVFGDVEPLSPPGDHTSTSMSTAMIDNSVQQNEDPITGYDSDLTDLSDIDMSEEEHFAVKEESSPSPSKITSDAQKRKSSGDSETESEYESKPSKKKSKKKNSNTKSSKSRISKGKGKLKKGKGKGKRIVDPDSEEEDEKPKKRVILAKEVEWNDIPNWGIRTDCPLLQLPEDILDLCFGMNTDLGVRDYVALAGVSKLFRSRLDPDVFHSICWAKGVMEISRWYSRGTAIAKPEMKYLADHIFSRQFAESRKEPPNNVYRYGNPTHYIPDGPREGWSEAQYIVYKEEQAKWKKTVHDSQVKTLQDAIKKQQEEEKRTAAWAIVGGRSRRVLATINGRKNGQPAVEKDGHGLPIKVKTAQSQSQALDPTPRVPVNTAPKLSRAKRNKSRKWTVPDTDGEEEYEIRSDELLGENQAHIYDYWPNKWRETASSWVNHRRINKSEVMRVYKVSEAELLCLKHLLVTNPMSNKSPQQAYIEAAVEALAWRSHGGFLEHKEYLNQRLIKKRKMAENREAKAEKAKKEGTYVYKHKKEYIAPFYWHWGFSSGRGPNGDCASDCEACDVEEYEGCDCGRCW